MVPGKAGRFVCGPCNRHYELKLATGVRPTSVRPAGGHTPDPCIIRQSVNAAQRSSSMQPPPVIATSHGHRAGPNVAIPSSWHHDNGHVQRSHLAVYSSGLQGRDARPAAYSLGLPGYSANHVMYGAEREHWAKQAYSTPPAETISLEISAVHEGGNKRKGGRGVSFGNICEGKKDIDAQSDAPQLITLALETDFHGARTNLSFVMGDGWSTHPPNFAYFYKQCVHPSHTKGPRTSVFKTKQFQLSVVVPMAQWDEYELWLEKIEEARENRDSHHTRSLMAPPSGDSTDRFQSTSTVARSLMAPPSGESTNRFQSTSTVARSLMAPPSGDNTDLFESTSTVATTSSGSMSFHQPLFNPPLAESSNAAMSSKAPSFKRIFERDSTPASLPSSPPHKKLAPAFQSPDCEHLREALQSGGTADLDVQQVIVLTLINETIQFFPVKNRALSDILKDKQHRAFKLDPESSQAGMLSVETSLKKMIGAGGHPETELGSRPQRNVAVKRPFYKNYPLGSSNTPGNFTIGRYVIKEEMAKLFREANVLYWAGSLLQFAYDFIDHCIYRSTEPPPFDIPRLRFVDAGLAVSYAQTPPTTSYQKSKANIPRSGYLVEELISGDFLKYIHNMDCQPMLDPDEPGYEIAEFLACTQHIQYVKTGGLAFISDYQGDSELLTDPQVLTHPTVNGGKNMFGDGNIEVSVSKFEREHICNKFCRWSGFGLKSFEAEDSEECSLSMDK
ncbi:hypothetical protein F4604DRAFT_1684996 [Suillus subluteus]|nr:hypothetical protein F4604DRAFT_1684996 [Suillus subluteus]